MNKLDQLKANLGVYKKVAIAYSGGCDSNFLFHVAVDTLGKENVLAVMCEGAMMSQSDLHEAKEMLKEFHYVIVPIDVFSVKEFRTNDKKRCYYCKKNVMTKVIEQARLHNIEYVLDGKNLDDDGVYRPGAQACAELGVLSPLFDAKMKKQEIREYSKQLGITTFNKPANACLASRFDYNTELTLEKLQRVDQAESYLHEIGIYHCRVRVNDDLARIEVEKKDFMSVFESDTLIEKMKALGFRYVTLDMEGITSGGYDR